MVLPPLDGSHQKCFEGFSTLYFLPSTLYFLAFGPKNRGDKIRTCDLCVPNAALYQAEPHPGLDSLEFTI